MKITEKNIIIIVFWIAPLIVFSLFLLPLGGSGVMLLNFTSGGVDPSGISYKESYVGTININQLLSNELKFKLYDFIGKRLDVPVIAACFSNNGTDYPIDLSSFDSKIIINNKEIILEYNDIICHDLDSNTETFNVEWITTYNYNISEVKKSGNVVDLTNTFNKKTKLVYNNLNIFYLFIIFLIGYWAICWLITRVIIISVNGLGLKRNN